MIPKLLRSEAVCWVEGNHLFYKVFELSESQIGVSCLISHDMGKFISIPKAIPVFIAHLFKNFITRISHALVGEAIEYAPEERHTQSEYISFEFVKSFFWG